MSVNKPAELKDFERGGAIKCNLVKRDLIKMARPDHMMAGHMVNALTKSYRFLAMGIAALCAFGAYDGAYNGVRADEIQKTGSLSSEISHMLQSLPAINAEASKVRAAGEAIKETRSGYYPTLSVTGEAGFTEVSNPTTRAQETNEELDYKTTTVTLRQNIFNGLGTRNQSKADHFALQAAQYNYANVVQSSVSAAAKAYIEIMRAQALLDISSRKQETIRSQMELEDERVRSGAGVSVDVLQAKSRLQRALDEALGFDRQLSRAVAAYEKSFGSAPNLNMMRDDLSELILVPATLQQAIDVAIANNPALFKSKLDADAMAARKNAAWSGYAPSLDLVGSNEWSYDADGIEDQRSTTAKAYLELSWDLFSGFATKAAVAKLSENWEEMLSNADTTRLRILESVAVAWGRLEHANKRRSLYENGIILSQELLTSRQKLRESGKETALGVLDAQNELFQAEISLIGAEFDSLSSAYDLANAIGILTPENIGLVTPDPMNEMVMGAHDKDGDQAYMPQSIIAPENDAGSADETEASLPPQANGGMVDAVDVQADFKPAVQPTTQPTTSLDYNNTPSGSDSFDERSLPVQPIQLMKLDRGDRQPIIG
ncbi:MAG: TolC family protein [Alphaproteobacteria bacterium]